MNSNLKQYLVIDLFLIILVGIIMVYSSSYIYAKEVLGSSTHFLFKQLSFFAVGGLAAFIFSKTKFKFWFENSYKLNILSNIFLFFTLTPLGISIKGSNRWLNFGGLNLQPGEFVKYTVLLSSVYYFTNLKNYSKNDKLLYSLHLIVPLLLLIAQPDFGTFSITAIVIAFVCFLSDFPRKYFYSAVAIGGASLFAILIAAPYRLKRLMTFLDPWADPQNSGFQIIQSYLAFANGHIFGEGIGNSNEKLFYLPEAYNDFIFSVLGEELGLLGVLFVILLYTIFLFLGFKLALTNKSKVNTIFTASIVFTIGFQAFLNMAVVLGLLPTKGLNLPFISYGGSSLLANLVGIGLMFCALTQKSQISDNNIRSTFTL